MSESTNKICKVPKCTKEVPGEKGVFCSRHSKLIKESGLTVGSSVVALASVASAAIFAFIKEKD